MHPVERTFMATCQPKGAGLDVPIHCERLTVDADQVQRHLCGALKVTKKMSVTVGAKASFGCLSVVTPFTAFPDDYYLGPGTSSYNIEDL
jgi:hypothetical protein